MGFDCDFVGCLFKFLFQFIKFLLFYKTFTIFKTVSEFETDDFSSEMAFPDEFLTNSIGIRLFSCSVMTSAARKTSCPLSYSKYSPTIKEGLTRKSKKKLTFLSRTFREIN